jgi:hypothetical protein
VGSFLLERVCVITHGPQGMPLNCMKPRNSTTSSILGRVSCVQSTTKNNIYSCWNLGTRRYHFKSTKRGQKSHRFRLIFQGARKLAKERDVFRCHVFTTNSLGHHSGMPPARLTKQNTVTSTRSRALTERKHVADEDISAWPQKRARSVSLIANIFR